MSPLQSHPEDTQCKHACCADSATTGLPVSASSRTARLWLLARGNSGLLSAPGLRTGPSWVALQGELRSVGEDGSSVSLPGPSGCYSPSTLACRTWAYIPTGEEWSIQDRGAAREPPLLGAKSAHQLRAAA